MECPQGYKRINATFCQGMMVPKLIVFIFSTGFLWHFLWYWWFRWMNPVHCSIFGEKMVSILLILSHYWQLCTSEFFPPGKITSETFMYPSLSLMMHKDDFIRILLLCFSVEIHCFVTVFFFAKQWICRHIQLSQMKLAIQNNFCNHERLIMKE